MIRYFYNGKINERPIGVFHAKQLDAESLSSLIMKILLDNGLSLDDCVGQCYDGASVMKGVQGGVQAKLKERIPHAVYIHCYAHRLNLVLVRTITDIPELKDFFNTAKNLYNFLTHSNTRHTLFVDAQKELGQNVLELERNVPTRWLYWYKSLNKIYLRFEAILTVLETIALLKEKDAQIEAKVLRKCVEKPKFIFLLVLLKDLLGITNSLSMQLQNQSLSLFNVNSLISSTGELLSRKKNEESFDTVMQSACKFAKTVNISLNSTECFNDMQSSNR